MIPQDRLDYIKNEVRHLLETYEVSNHYQVKGYLRKLINDELQKNGMKFHKRRETVEILVNDLWKEIT